MLILSLFPGIGLLDIAFEDEGFCVVRGPDTLWGGNIKRFCPPAGKFDGIIGGPPCQTFSRLRYLVEANGYKIKGENMIPEFERCIEDAQPTWFLMENVREAPIPHIERYGTHSFFIDNRSFGGEQRRIRRITFGMKRHTPNLLRDLQMVPLEHIDTSPTVCASGGVKMSLQTQKTHARMLGHKTAGVLQQSLKLQGLPQNFLDDAPFTLKGKHKVISNGVPLPMGKALAKAVAIYIKRAENANSQP